MQSIYHISINYVKTSSIRHQLNKKKSLFKILIAVFIMIRLQDPESSP